MAGIAIQIEGKSYDLDDFELGDLEWLEEHIGGPLSDEDYLTSMKALVGLVYLIKRRDNPAFTVDEARKVKLSVLNTGDDAEDGEPAEGVDTPPKKRPTRAPAGS